MFGIDDTNTWAPGSAPRKVLSAVANSDLNVAVGVIVATDDVHTSLAPISTVTYCTRWAAAACSCPPRSAILAPVLASLYSLPATAGWAARTRWYCDVTALAVPV